MWSSRLMWSSSQRTLHQRIRLLVDEVVPNLVLEVVQNLEEGDLKVPEQQLERLACCFLQSAQTQGVSPRIMQGAHEASSPGQLAS